MAGKVTVGLASHWPCVTDLCGLSAYKLNGLVREIAPHLCAISGLVDFTIPLFPECKW